MFIIDENEQNEMEDPSEDDILNDVYDNATSSDEEHDQNDAENKAAENTNQPDDEEITAASQKASDTQKASDDQEVSDEAKEFEGWSDDQKAAFQGLPEESRQFVLDHQKRLNTSFSEKEAGLQEQITSFEPVQTVLNENSDYLTRRSEELGIQPDNLIGNLLSTENALRFGSFEDKSEILLAMAKDYGVPMMLGGFDVAENSGEVVIQDVDQDFIQRHDHAQTMENERAALAAERAKLTETNSAQTANNLEVFKGAVDQNNQKLHPYFDLVADKMSTLIASKEARDLEQAYTIAVKPILAATQTTQDKQAKASSAETVGKAKAAQRLNISTQPKRLEREQTEDELLSDIYDQASSIH